MRFPFISPTTHKGEGALMPFLPIQLHLQGRKVKIYGLLDTGMNHCKNNNFQRPMLYLIVDSILVLFDEQTSKTSILLR